MADMTLEQRTQRTRALSRLSGLRDGRRYGQKFGPAREQDLLAWAATLPDEDILAIRNTGPATLSWIREHQPPAGLSRASRSVRHSDPTMLGKVMQVKGWRVELFWNESAGWFTARMVSLRDRGGKRGYEGGYLVPYEDPIGVSGGTPEEALANLSDAVLEWA